MVSILKGKWKEVKIYEIKNYRMRATKKGKK
jgi:hypothetical protein